MSDKQVRAQYTREFKQEAVRQVRSGQAIAVVAKVLGIPKASLGNWVRLSAKGELDGAGGGGKSIQVSPEQTVLEAARAHFDVQRFRRLVQLAEDNYVQHRYAFLQIQSRVKAGVGRGVDLEQAGARLALAESNLATEQANLHDVTVRYQRIVGDLPPAKLPALAMLKDGAPASAGDAVTQSLRNSAAISASVEGLRAAREAASGRNSAFQPRVEARLAGASGRNVDGIEDQKRNGSAHIVLNWNLYNGGSDNARVNQQKNC